MREIKFRGKNTKGEWVYGSLVTTTYGLHHKQAQHTKTWIVESAFGNGGWFNVTRRQYVKPETVGQFTGEYDQSGKEIYEGDIITCCAYQRETSDELEKDQEVIVAYRDGYFYPLGYNAGWRSSCYDIDILGNIHDNYELIENSIEQQ